MSDNSVSGEHSLNERHPSSSMTDPIKTVRVIQQAKKGPMHPTPLYIFFSFFSKTIKHVTYFLENIPVGQHIQCW